MSGISTWRQLLEGFLDKNLCFRGQKSTALLRFLEAWNHMITNISLHILTLLMGLPVCGGAADSTHQTLSTLAFPSLPFCPGAFLPASLQNYLLQLRLCGRIQGGLRGDGEQRRSQRLPAFIRTLERGRRAGPSVDGLQSLGSVFQLPFQWGNNRLLNTSVLGLGG